MARELGASVSAADLRNLSDAIRIISADAVEAAGSGHPGMPLGMSDVMSVLCAKFLRYIPFDPKWFNRDRLVLSAGHGSMLLYAFYYLAGYINFSLDDIKNFRQAGSKSAGHPEYGLYDAIETSTGPLGQGLANAVGMAIAQKKHQIRLGSNLCDYMTYAIVGDGCLMEGISYESISLAAHLKLDNLMIIFDSNKISIDGDVSLAVSENQKLKFESFGFEVVEIDGHNFSEIENGFSSLLSSDIKKPKLLICHTNIGQGANIKQGKESCHGSPLGKDEIKYLKSNIISLQDSEKEDFFVPSNVKLAWNNLWSFNKQKYHEWQNSFTKLEEQDKLYITDFKIILPDFSKYSNITRSSTRSIAGQVISDMLQLNDKIIAGSADLSISNNLKNNNIKAIKSDDFSGNFIHYGVRENAMAAIMNGLALSGFFAIGGSFLVFSDYMRPSIRLSALMQLPVLYFLTHDSIGVGEDGPTHQPVEHLASFRAMPGIAVFRPSNINELAASISFCSQKKLPTILSLTRQDIDQTYIPAAFDANKGASIILDSTNPDITIFSSGSEVSLAIDVAQTINRQHPQMQIRVISVFCMDFLLKQTDKYLENITANPKVTAAIEAASSFGWHKIIGRDGMFFGVNDFGISAPGHNVFDHFGLNAENIASKILEQFNINNENV